MPTTKLNDHLELENIESENADDESTPLEYDITIVPSDFTLETIYTKWKNGDIIVPKFQRRYVWKINQASRLIESCMMGLPIPPIFFFVQADQKNIVIDGMQRLLSIIQFFEGTFGENQNGRKRKFELEGINEKSRWYKKKFSDFLESDQRKLKNTVLRCVIVSQLRPESDHTSIYHIFERLNTGGTTLQDQEVRNCLYAGKLNDTLIELNKDPNWRLILGKPKLDPRQKDVKLILRYMALFHNNEKYSKPMKDFLSTFMDENRNPSEEFLDEEKIRFRETCRIIVECLGERPFHPTGPLNPSMFDGTFIAFARHYNNCPENIARRVESLRYNLDFVELVSDATTDVGVVKKRLRLVDDKLFG